MEPTVEIRAEEVYPCPFCGKKYATKEEALNCFRAFKWNEEFPVEDYLWKWCIFASPSCPSHVMAIIPSRVDKRYCWSESEICTRRTVSLFNSFGNNYFNIYKDTTVLRLSFMEGFEKYRLLPPVQYMRGIPYEIYVEVKDVLLCALEYRLKEFEDAGIGASKALIALASFEFPEIVSKLTINHTGKYIDVDSDTKVDYLPETKIISGEQLLAIHKYSPELTRLVQVNMDAHKPF